MKCRHTVVALLALAFLIPLAVAQTGSSPATGNVEQNLMKIEQEMLDALLKGDTSAAKKYLADTFVFTAPDGETQTKAQLLANVTSGDLKITASTNADMKVQSYGNAAVVTYRSTDKGNYKGKDIGGQYRWTDFFVNKDGRWQIVGSHGCPVPDKK